MEWHCPLALRFQRRSFEILTNVLPPLIKKERKTLAQDFFFFFLIQCISGFWGLFCSCDWSKRWNMMHPGAQSCKTGWSACHRYLTVKQLHAPRHKDTRELITWLVTRKVWGIKSTVITVWSCECVADSQKRKPRGTRTQDVSVVFPWALGGKKWALFILLHKGESGTLLCFFHSRCGTQPGFCSPGYRYHNPEHHQKLL